MAEKSPLLFDAHLGMLRPANAVAEKALREVRGPVRVEIKGGVANQRRRGLYWSVAALVVPLLNEAHNLTLTEDELHDITRDKFGMFDEQKLPSGHSIKRYHSTSNRAMNEAERSEYTNRALGLWSTWTSVDVTTLKREAQSEAA